MRRRSIRNRAASLHSQIWAYVGLRGRVAASFNTYFLRILITTLVLFPSLMGEQRLITVHRNQAIRVNRRQLVNHRSAEPGVQTGLLIFESPNILIRLSRAITMDRLQNASLEFSCKEVGTFLTDEPGKDWTVGKGCHLTPSDLSKNRTHRH